MRTPGTTSRGIASAGALGSVMVCLALIACSEPTAAPVVSAPMEPSFIQMRPRQLYVDSLERAVQTYAIAYTEGGARLYSSAEQPQRFSWSSSAPGVLEVDQNGSVTGGDWGNGTVTATHDSGVAGEMWVNVDDAVRLDWSVPTGATDARGGIAIGTDGTIYVSTRTRLVAISPQGGALWTSSPGGLGTPAVGLDGTLYVGMSAGGGLNPTVLGGLAAVNPDGSVQWEVTEIGHVSSSPALAADGTIYVAGGHHVYAVHPSGEIIWAFEGAGGFGYSSPAVAADGTIYIGNSDDHLYAINPDGSARWTFKADDQIQSSPSIGADGTIYFGSYDERLYAVNPDGTERWRTRSLGSLIYSSASIGPDGTIYVGAAGVFAIDPSGSVRWTFRAHTGGGIPHTPILGADATVYFPDYNTSGALVMYAFDAQGKLIWDYLVGNYTGYPFSASPAIGLDGRVLAAASDGTIHAFVESASTNGGYEGSPWPKEHGNRGNAGRQGG